MPPQGFEKFDETRRTAYLAILRDGGRRRAAARSVGIHPETVSRYIARHPAFADEVTLAEMEANEVVEDALFLAAKKGNVTAMQLWLYNRDPEHWSDRKVLKAEHSGPGGGPIAIDSSSYVRKVLANPAATDLALRLLDEVAEADSTEAAG